jgi:predicted N-acetyltransferase YhbS
MNRDSSTEVVIDQLPRHPDFADIATDWLEDEWGSVPRAETLKMLSNTVNLPPALIAISEGRPIGVLGFKRHVIGGGEDGPELWINAVFVVPEHRNAGIGSQLVTDAIDAVAAFGERTLYVYTDIPEFYEKRGWTRHSEREETGMTTLTIEPGVHTRDLPSSA